MPSCTRSRVKRTLKAINATKGAMQRLYFKLWSKRLAFMAPHGKQSKAQQKTYARYMAKFMRLTKSLPLDEWGDVHSTITKNVRAKWLVRSNNADYLEPIPLLKLRSMEIPPMLGADAKWFL